MEAYLNKKRARDDSDDSLFDSPVAKRFRDDLLDILDDSDPDLTAQVDLASVMKSFEEEISASSTPPVPVVDLTSDSGESQPELGYLLGATDDDLGLPPTTGEEVKEGAEFLRDSSGFGDIWGYNDGFSTYDSLEFGIGDNINISSSNNNSNGEYVALEGLFDYSDVGFGSNDFSDFSWRPETLPAL